MTTGERIRNARKKKGLTQKALGEKCNMPDSQIRQYELGMVNPKIEQLRRIASALGVGLEVFLTNDEQSLFESMANLYLKSDSDMQELESLDEHTSQENCLIVKFRELNEKGRNKVVDYAEDLSKTKEYTDPDTPK